MQERYRFWGPPNGPGVEKWQGAAIIPAHMAGPMLLRLGEMRDAGRIGAFAVKRLGRKGAAVWIGRTPKSQRPACGAKTRAGGQCRASAVEGMERCRMHGGLSTGAKTEEGRERIRESNRRRARARRGQAMSADT